MTAQPRRKTSPAPKGRNKPAQGNALGNAVPEDQSPEGAGQISSATHKIGWRNTTLGAVITSIDTGKSFRCEERPPIASEVGVVKVSAVTWGTYDEEESKTCLDAARVEPRYLIEEGDFLFSRANTIQLIGACVIAGAPSRRLMLSDKILRFRFTDEVEPKWVLHWLRSKQGRSEIERLSSGNQESMRNIGQERIRAIALPLPPPDDQRRIVAEIEKQFTRLEAGVAALRRVQANLKRYRAAVLKAACEGRLVPTEAELSRSGVPPLNPDSTAKPASSKAGSKVSTSPKRQDAASTFESGQQLLARILTERRQNWQGRGKYKEPAELDTSKLFPLPKGWTWTTLDALAEIKGGITKDQNRKHSAPTRSVPYLRVANVQRGYIDLTEVKEIVTTEDEINELALKPGDILFNEGGDRDKLGRGWVWCGQLPECIHQNHVFRARLYVSEMNPKLVSWYANTFGQKFFFDEGKHTTNLASISMSKLKSLPVPIPPPSEQTRIVAEVERRLSVVEELEAVVTTNLQRATRLRHAILQKAFTGDLA